MTNNFSVSRQGLIQYSVCVSSWKFRLVQLYVLQAITKKYSKWLRITSNRVIILQSEQSSESDGNWLHMDTNLGSQHVITEVQSTSGDLAKPQALPQLYLCRTAPVM